MHCFINNCVNKLDLSKIVSGYTTMRLRVTWLNSRFMYNIDNV